MASPQASTSALPSPSSSTHSTSSTPASSTLNSALKRQQQQGQPAQLDSDMEILEERNGSPPPPTKRKAQDPAEASDVEVKKPKVAVSTPQSKASTSKSSTDSASKKAIPSAAKDETTLVELKNGKFVTKQKPLKLKEAGSAIRARIAFTDYVTERFKDEEAKLDEWPKEHHSIVAALIHESTQTLTGLVTSTRNGIVEYIQGAQGAVEDSQEEDESATTSSIAARVPSAPIKALIESIATRNNYGLEASDLPEGLPEGVTEVPLGLQLPAWEVHDEENLPAEFESKLTKRKADRVQIKTLATELFLALPSDEQSDLLHSKKPSKSSGKATSTPVASTSKSKKAAAIDTGSSATKPAKAGVKKEKVKKEKTEEELAEEEEKAKVKREKEKEKEVKRIAKEKANKEKEAKAAEKEAKKAAKAKEEAEKQAKQEKAQAAKNKQQNMFSAFLAKGGTNTKKSASPVPEASSSGKTTDFDRVFHPFTVRTGVVQAPINAFHPPKTGKAGKASKEFSVTPNSDDSLTAKDALQTFLSTLPKHHIIPHHPHPVPPVSVRQTVIAINESLVTGMDATSYYDVLKDRKKIPIKLLKFHADVRPGYVGTWSKTSRTIGPRNPFEQDDALLNYAVDSEEEWEEEVEDADAEDVGSGGERSDDDGEESEALSDDWMCDDDEIEFEPGHDGEDEMMLPPPGDDDMIIMEDSGARKKVEEREKKRKAAREGAKKRKAVGPLIPLVKGPVWEDKIGQTAYIGFSSMKIEMLNGAPIGLDPLTYVSKSFVQSASALAKGKGVDKDVKPIISADPTSPSDSTTTTSGKEKAAPKPVKAIPSHLMPQFIRLVEASDKTSKPLLLAELLEGLKEVAGEGTKVTKVMIDGAIKTLPVTKVKAKEETPNGAKWLIPQAVKDLYDSAPAPMVVD